jgi:glycosyltransferase involved in cell wall biosynthesis
VLSGKRIAVVVPAFNEAALIAETLRGIPAFVDRIVVVDDASVDDTLAHAEGAACPRTELLRHAENRGVGAAIATGIADALRNGADVIAVMAGDGQMDPDELASVIAPIESGAADFVKGNRFLDPNVARAMPWTRQLGNRVLSFFTRLATGLAIDDAQCGYVALSRDAAARLAFDSLWPRYGYPNDLLARVARERLRLTEIGVRAVYGSERSGVRLRDALFVVPWVILRGLWTAARRPVHTLDRARGHRHDLLSDL